MRCSLSGVVVIGRSLLPSFAAAPLAVVGMRQAHGARLLPTSHPELGAPPWAAGSAALVRISGPRECVWLKPRWD